MDHGPCFRCGRETTTLAAGLWLCNPCAEVIAAELAP